MIAPLVLALLSGGNRLWFVELEIEGPLEGIELDCGPDGVTRVSGPFLAGEERLLEVPVPVHCPAGLMGLASLPLPRILLAEGSRGSARLRGWADHQPGAELELRTGPLLARPRPPAEARNPRAELPELLVVGLALLLLLCLPKRALLALIVASAAGALAFGLARGRGQDRERLLVELDPGLDLALLVRSARDELPLPDGRLEVVPADRPLELSCPGTGDRRGRARAVGATLFALEPLARAELAPEENAWKELAAVWTRGPGVSWRAHGAWRLGERLPAGEPAREGPGFPGWLAAGLAPDRPVLLALARDGTFVRCPGFEGGGD